MNEINQKKLTRWDKNAKELRHLISLHQGRIEREKEDENCEDDLLQGKFKHFKGCITTDGKDVKHDYEGDLDGFELWLKNWNKDDDWETYMNESNKMLKLKDLITEDLDKSIKKKIDELGELTKEINRVKNEILKPMEDKYKEVVSTTLPILEKLGKETLTTKKYVFRILKKKHYRSSVSYRELFSSALTKVNRQTKILLNNLKDDLTKMSLIGSRYKISPVEMKEGTFTDWIKKYTRKLVRKIIPKLKSVVSANRELRKLI